MTNSGVPRTRKTFLENHAGCCRSALALDDAAPFTVDMFGVVTSDDYQPVGWVGRYPIHVTTLLLVVHVACMIVSCFLVAFGAGGVLDCFAFDSAQVLHGGRIWQIATYAFRPLAVGEFIWFAIEMYLLFAFGREVERFIGRRAFIALYAVLLLAPAILLSIWGLGQRVGLAGSATIHFGIFIAFAAIYPNIEMFLRVQAKWIARHIYRRLHLATARLSRLVGTRRPLDECGPGHRFHLSARRRPGTRMAPRMAFALPLETLAPRRPSTHRAPRRRAGRYLRFDRSGARQDLQERHRQPDGK